MNLTPRIPGDLTTRRKRRIFEIWSRCESKSDPELWKMLGRRLRFVSIQVVEDDVLGPNPDGDDDHEYPIYSPSHDYVGIPWHVLDGKDVQERLRKFGSSLLHEIVHNFDVCPDPDRRIPDGSRDRIFEILFDRSPNLRYPYFRHGVQLPGWRPDPDGPPTFEVAEKYWLGMGNYYRQGGETLAYMVARTLYGKRSWYRGIWSAPEARWTQDQNERVAAEILSL